MLPTSLRHSVASAVSALAKSGTPQLHRTVAASVLRSFSTTRPSHYDENAPPPRQAGIVERYNYDFIDNAKRMRQGLELTREEYWKRRSREFQKNEEVQRGAPNAYFGRTAFVVNGAVDAGYKRLNLILQRNGVRRELKRAERHEKKGVKRRRLSSQRWRTKFAHEVRKKVQMVQAIRRRSG